MRLRVRTLEYAVYFNFDLVWSYKVFDVDSLIFFFLVRFFFLLIFVRSSSSVYEKRAKKLYQHSKHKRKQ